VQLDRGVIVSIFVVEWIERARKTASNGGCGDRVHAEIQWLSAVAAVLWLAVKSWWVAERRLIRDVVEFGCGQGPWRRSLRKVGSFDSGHDGESL
jgi:hypothetical protein